jgi:hypothetical protein
MLLRAAYFSAVVTVAPMAKKDAVSKRLAEEIALTKRITDGIKNNPPSPGLLDLATPDQRDELAASLWLNEKDPFFGPISRAFKAFGLDHRNHSDWHGLVARLARVLFPIRRPRGKKWTAERLFLLLAQVASYKRKHPDASDPAICRWLQTKSYKDETEGALRRACTTRVIPSAIASLLGWPTLWREARRETGLAPLRKLPLLKA